MIIKDYTEVELNYFRDNCNFVGCEKDVFELRCRGIPLEQVAEHVNMSVDGVKKVSRKVNKKIVTALTIH